MASRKSDPTGPEPTGPRYVWPEYPDDPTLGGAITPEMFAALHTPPTPPAPSSSPGDDAE